MVISDLVIKDLLKTHAQLEHSRLEELVQAAAQQDCSLQDFLLQSGEVSEEALTQWYGDTMDIPFVKLDPKKIDVKLLTLIPEHITRRHRVVLFGEQDGIKQLAMEDPDDLHALEVVEAHLGERPAVYLAVRQNITAVLVLYRDETSHARMSSRPEIGEAGISEGSFATKTINDLIEDTLKKGASDIHIEPRADCVWIRYRVDGVLIPVKKLPKKFQGALTARLKLLAGLNVDEHYVPQDGQFKTTHKDVNYTLHISTLPITDGEKVVIRLKKELNTAPTLKQLGLWGNGLKIINQAITEPRGIVLVSGPIDSGKSTTLFSLLSLLSSSSVSISTVEDPIAYKITGANQTQISQKAGMTFTSGLKAVLRQDPNIIMVGEMSDTETAQTITQAALGGHLVFSALTASNAASCVSQLLGMGIEPFLVASTVKVIIGQRLVRKLCPECRDSYEPDRAEGEELKKLFRLNPGIFKEVHEQEKIAAARSDLSTTATSIKRLWKAKEGGCKACSNLGYKGRTGIFEVLQNTPEFQNEIIKNQDNVSLQNRAINTGMHTMQIDGFIKALLGQTTLEEVLRVAHT